MNRVKTTVIFLFVTAALMPCSGQGNKHNTNNTMKNDVELIKVPVSVGVGTLDLLSNPSTPLYCTENDAIPFDILTIETDAEYGVLLFKTNRLKSLNPYKMNGGTKYTHEERESEWFRELGSMEIIELKFRVVEATDNYFRVVVDERSFETVVIRKTAADDVRFVYETWENFMLRAMFVEFIGDFAIYDQPDGKKIFEKTGEENRREFIPFKVVEVSGDWAKVIVPWDKERFVGDEIADGWVKWKNDKEILVNITDFLYE